MAWCWCNATESEPQNVGRNRMRNVEKITLLLILFSFFSCKESAHNKVKSSIKKEKTITKLKVEQKKINITKVDNRSFEKIIDTTLEISKKYISKNNFKKKIKHYENYEFGSVTSELKIGNFFSKVQRHLIIKTNTNSDVYFNIFLIKNDNFLPVLKHIESNMTFTKDTIIDVNNDGENDFLVNWYGSSGCCLKNFYTVYLSQKSNIDFSKSFEFVNPTFSPKEKIIRGVCYGHPGNTEMYKFRWNNSKIDTIEYISYEIDKKGIKTGKIILSKKSYLENPNSKYKRLNDIPKEYKKIYGYDWFIGKI
jgi:hypothetical protein